MEDTGIRVFPPLVCIGALILGFLLDWAWPSQVGLPDIARWVIGGFLIALPFVILPSVLSAFHRAGQHYDVRRVPTRLVTGGPFRYSRNPGYMLAIGFCAGIGLVANNPWVFLAIVPAMIVLHYTVVLREEAVLEKQFGEDYLEYRRRVRRWI